LNLRKTVTNVVVIVIESEEPYVVISFWRKKVRNANGEGSSWKSAANKTCEGRKIPFIENACDNVDFRRTNEMNPKLTGAKYNKVQKIH
jgi:hypothetical protein